MAHSGGTFLGIKVIERYPELYEAYIGVSQIVYQKLSEMKAYEYIVMRYGQDAKKRNICQNLLAHPVALTGPLPAYYTRIRDYAMHDLGVGTMRKMKNVITGLFIPSLLFGEYSLTDKLNLWRGKWRSGISVIWNDISSHDLSTESTSFQLPVHFLHGIYDYTCSYELAKQYHEVITAPHKGFYSLHESAHSPIFEEPEECVRIIKQNVLNVTLPQPSTS
jgi:pimeloyl-ACP methyl ester carboxylesterase